MFNRVIAVLSDVQDRAMRLSRMSPHPQRPLSTGIPARPFLGIFLFLPSPLLLSLTLPLNILNVIVFCGNTLPLLGMSVLPNPLLRELPYLSVALLLSKHRTQFSRPTATWASATATWSVTPPVVTPPAAGTRFRLLMTVFFDELGRWVVPCNLKYGPR